MERREELTEEDLDKLNEAMMIYNKWCDVYKDCKGCPIYKFEGQECGVHCYGVEGYVESRCLVPAATATPFFELVDYAQYCLECLMEGCEEISREDLLKAIDDIINYLEMVISNVRKTNSS